MKKSMFLSFIFFTVLLSLFETSIKFSLSETIRNKKVFLKAFYALDEPRFHCVDIPGHKERVKLNAALVVHTCKEGIWNKDELFDFMSISKGKLRMIEYNLCVKAESESEGSKIFLHKCDNSKLQLWSYNNYHVRLKEFPDSCLTIGKEKSYLTRGGKRLPTRHMARKILISKCSEESFQRQVWRFEEPLKDISRILPFK
ncbi:MAG: RICIN domain-containing protein [Nitrospinota bacterium]|nr:RICIN domain-containing protein [Nitrospinota bacterium]